VIGRGIPTLAAARRQRSRTAATLCRASSRLRNPSAFRRSEPSLPLNDLVQAAPVGLWKRGDHPLTFADPARGIRKAAREPRAARF